jgi:hypothetical protein
MLIWILVITLVLVFWFQYSNNNNAKDIKNKYCFKYIFNTIKIPLIVVIGLVVLYYYYDCNNTSKINQNVFLSLPNF